MNYYLYEIEKIQYKNHKIDDTNNLLIFNELFEVNDTFKSSNLEHTITGLCAVILHTNKIYRTIQDIDIVVDLINLEKCIKILSKNYNYFYLDDPVSFFEYSLINNYPIIFIHKTKKIKLELQIVNKNHDWYIYKKTFSKKINNNIFYYSLPLKLQKLEKYFYGRDKDYDDLNFYLPLINKSDI